MSNKATDKDYLLRQLHNLDDVVLENKYAGLVDIAPAFSTSVSYAVGDYVSYEGAIYKCTTAHSAGAWASGDFTAVVITDELGGSDTYLEQTVTTVANTDTVVTFTNNLITSDKVIDVFTGRSTGDVSGAQNVFPYKDIYVDGTNHTCTITYPALSSAISLKVRIYIQ